jgi:hypothetical protein
MKRSLYPKRVPVWKNFLSKYRYQALALLIIIILLMVIGGVHNPSELEGVYVG